MKIVHIKPVLIRFDEVQKWKNFENIISTLQERLKSAEINSDLKNIDEIDFLKYDIIHVHEIETAKKLIQNNIDFVLSLDNINFNNIKNNEKEYREIIDYSLFTTTNDKVILEFFNNPQKIYFIHFVNTGFINEYNIIELYNKIDIFKKNKNELNNFAQEFINLYSNVEQTNKNKIVPKINKSYEISFLDGCTVTNTTPSYDLNVKFYNATTKELIFQHINKPDYWCSPSIKYFVPWEIHIDDEIVKMDLVGKNVLIKIDDEIKMNLIDKWLQTIDIFRIENVCNIFINLSNYAHIFEKIYPNLNFHLSDDIDIYASYKIGVDLENNYYRNVELIKQDKTKIAEDILFDEKIIYPDFSLTETDITDDKYFNKIINDISEKVFNNDKIEHYNAHNFIFKDDEIQFTMDGINPKILNLGNENKHIKFIDPSNKKILYETNLEPKYYTMLTTNNFIDVIITSNDKEIVQISKLLEGSRIIFRIDEYNDIEKIKQFLKENPLIKTSNTVVYANIIDLNKLFIISDDSVIQTEPSRFIKYFTIIDLR